MTFLGNLIWLIFGGLSAAVGYALSGLSICLTLIGIPFGLQSLKLAGAMLWPFGKEVVVSEEASSPLYFVLNLIWLVLFGWVLALNHLIFALLLAITIVGLPFARQHMKLLELSVMPFGRELK
ncbi:MAG: YccF domain-containing protein [Candidatus Eremiobacterota bacterium]